MLKNIKLFFVITVFLVMVIMLLGCSNPGINGDNELLIQTVDVINSTEIEATFSDGTVKKITDFTPNPLKLGENNISFTYNEVIYEHLITLDEDNSTLKLSKSNIILTTGNTTHIKAEAFKSDGITMDNINVISNNESIATAIVDEESIITTAVDGKTIIIEGVAEGETTITVTSSSGKTADCSVNVYTETNTTVMLENYLLDGRPDNTDVDFPFTIVQGGIYSFITKQYEDIICDTILTLYDINNNLITSIDQDVYDTLTIDLQPGDYTLVVSNYKEDEAMVCSLDILLIE